MSPTGNVPFIQVGEGPKRRMHNSKKNKNQETNIAEKEDDADSTAIKTTAIFISTTITAEKEDDTDSTATMTTSAFTSVSELEWDEYITERLAGVKPSPKWRTPTSQVRKEEKQSKLDTAGNIQVQTIKGVFVFGSAARIYSDRDKELTSCTLRISKSPGTCWQSN